MILETVDDSDILVMGVAIPVFRLAGVEPYVVRGISCVIVQVISVVLV